MSFEQWKFDEFAKQMEVYLSLEKAQTGSGSGALRRLQELFNAAVDDRVEEKLKTFERNLTRQLQKNSQSQRF